MDEKLRVGIIAQSNSLIFSERLLLGDKNEKCPYEIVAIVPESEAIKTLTPQRVARERHRDFALSFLGRFESFITRQFERLFSKSLAKLEDKSTIMKSQYETSFSKRSGADFHESERHALDGVPVDLFISAYPSALARELAAKSTFGFAYIRVGRDNGNGFFEVLERSPLTPYTVEFFSSHANECIEVFRGSIATKFLFSKNFELASSKGMARLRQILERTTISSFTYSGPKEKRSDFTETLEVGIQDFVKYGTQTVQILLSKVWRKLVGRDRRWTVAYMGLPLGKDDESAMMRELPNPRQRYLADPFVIDYQGETYVFVEDFDYVTKRGRIAAYQIDGTEAVECGIALEENFHLSFPFVFRANGEIYMVPETHEAHEVRLYRSVDFPLVWKLESVLLENVNAVDTVIFFKFDTFWMLTNLDSTGLGEFESELHLFYSRELNTTSWSSHPLNPISLDAGNSRNGGLLHLGDCVYRVYQRQGFDSYGVGFGLARIDTLTPSDYFENQVGLVLPDQQRVIGTHSLSVSEKALVTDVCRLSSIRH